MVWSQGGLWLGIPQGGLVSVWSLVGDSSGWSLAGDSSGWSLVGDSTDMTASLGSVLIHADGHSACFISHNKGSDDLPCPMHV